MSKYIRLYDPKYPKQPTDARIQEDDILLLEGEDGESVALSPPEVQQLVTWLQKGHLHTIRCILTGYDPRGDEREYERAYACQRVLLLIDATLGPDPEMRSEDRDYFYPHE